MTLFNCKNSTQKLSVLLPYKPLSNKASQNINYLNAESSHIMRPDSWDNLQKQKKSNRKANTKKPVFLKITFIEAILPKDNPTNI